MFEKICPGEEFLPKAPNPEDIIFDDGETADEKESGFEREVDTTTAMICDIETTGEGSYTVSGTAGGQDDLADTDNNAATTERDST